eukprot:TRINITY_DN2234_c1_g1_i2.p1 TRINITY_DN2234_c1_g1~~TRINITY_DN2234_c1_g1_i2.p1  ORF type:complete len:798 (-),score=134.33 TRINITY_DN2234_c1_g1_i2:1444-3837(-)
MTMNGAHVFCGTTWKGEGAGDQARWCTNANFAQQEMNRLFKSNDYGILFAHKSCCKPSRILSKYEGSKTFSNANLLGSLGSKGVFLGQSLSQGRILARGGFQLASETKRGQLPTTRELSRDSCNRLSRGVKLSASASSSPPSSANGAVRESPPLPLRLRTSRSMPPPSPFSSGEGERPLQFSSQIETQRIGRDEVDMDEFRAGTSFHEGSRGPGRPRKAASGGGLRGSVSQGTNGKGLTKGPGRKSSAALGTRAHKPDFVEVLKGLRTHVVGKGPTNGSRSSSGNKSSSSSSSSSSSRNGNNRGQPSRSLSDSVAQSSQESSDSMQASRESDASSLPQPSPGIESKFREERNRALSGLEALRRKTSGNRGLVSSEDEAAEDDDVDSAQGTGQGSGDESREAESRSVSADTTSKTPVEGLPTEAEARGVQYTINPHTLVPGDVVVHYKYGVARFTKFRKEVPAGKTKEVKYVHLQFADGEAKVSAKEARKVLYRFGSQVDRDRPVRLSKLKDTSQWERRKAKGQASIRRVVVDMMELHVQRLRQTRPCYAHFPEEMAALASTFPFTPTPDQIQAIQDIEADLTGRENPMDRLVCGDVGFGKTEVAVRAMFLAVLNQRQVMVLAPTTVLAKQHFKVLSARFQDYPDINVGLLSRFQKESQKRKVAEAIRDGSLQIVVGTHALLGSQIRYHNLGLLVVDEEQRFGVRHKEQITVLKSTVDVLTLSATPIPRTLYMAMNGFRDASLLMTPPPERLPIKTHLQPLSSAKVRQAIEREVARNGQALRSAWNNCDRRFLTYALL